MLNNYWYKLTLSNVQCLFNVYSNIQFAISNCAQQHAWFPSVQNTETRNKSHSIVLFSMVFFSSSQFAVLFPFSILALILCNMTFSRPSSPFIRWCSMAQKIRLFSPLHRYSMSSAHVHALVKHLPNLAMYIEDSYCCDRSLFGLCSSVYGP